MSYRERADLFARRVGECLAMLGYDVRPECPVEVGLSSRHKQSHCFDYGNQEVLVECKCYDWTAGGNNPSAKIATLNEAMMYFHSVSELYEKRIFISKTEKKGKRRSEALGEYYIRLYKHFIPDDVEVWEFDDASLEATKIFN